MSYSYGVVGQTEFKGVRVDGYPSYTPAHFDAAGKEVPQALRFNGYINPREKNGKKGKVQRFSFTAWRGLADSLAGILHKGIGLCITAQVGSYKRPVWIDNGDGTRRVKTDNAGQPIEEWHESWNVISPFGYEASRDFIRQEIRESRRPQFWNVEGHQDYQLWLNELEKRKANPVKFDPSQNMFGFAEVRPLKAGETLNINAYKHLATNTGAPQGMQGYAQGQQQPAQYTQNPPANAAPNPMAGMVQGQGYPQGNGQVPQAPMAPQNV